MSVDQTPYFKARAKTIAQRKARENTPVEEEVSTPRHQPSLLYKSLASTATVIGRDVADFAQLIYARRRDYLAFNAPVPTMSESDRDRFDQDSEKALRHLSTSIQQLTKRLKMETLRTTEEKKHLQMVTEILDQYLKRVAKVVTEMRKLRIRSVASRRDTWRLSSLVQASKKKKKTSLGNPIDTSDGVRRRMGRGVEKKEIESGATDSVLATRHTETVASERDVKPRKNSDGWENSVVFVKKEDVSNDEKSNEQLLSPQENAQLMAENEKMFEKFSHVHKEIDSLESHIAEIQNLQDTFAEKVLDQERDIDIINVTAINTTDNLRDGNEWIRQAISNSAGRRVVVLFCIIVITFTLLFLDWYNP